MPAAGACNANAAEPAGQDATGQLRQDHRRLFGNGARQQKHRGAPRELPVTIYGRVYAGQPLAVSDKNPYPRDGGFKMFYQFQQSLADVCVTKAELWAIINEVIGQSCGNVAFEKVPEPCIKAKISAVLEEVGYACGAHD